MTKRKFNKIIKRLVYLPRGLDLIKYLLNKLYSYYLKKTKSLKVAYPSTLMIEVTNHCNLKCITCPREYKYGDEMDKGYMDLNKLKTIVDQSYPYIDSIGLTGLGETFLYKDLEPAIDYIKDKSKGIIVSCSINAHLNNSVKIVKSIVNKIDTIQISIDGIDDVYNEIRLKGDFIFFNSNLKKIVEICKNSTTDIMLNMVVMKENYLQMSDMVTYTNDNNIKYINMIPINLVSKTDENVSYYNFFHSEKFKRQLKLANETAKRYNDIEFVFKNIDKNGSFNKCNYPWNHFYISWDGYLPPCCAKPFPKELNLGDVFNEGLVNSLNSKEYQEFRKSWHENKTPDFCEKCFVVNKIE